MANAKKLSVFGGGSSSRSMPRRSRAVSLGPRRARCACGAQETLMWLLTGTLEVRGERRAIGEWKCAACRQGSLAFAAKDVF